MNIATRPSSSNLGWVIFIFVSIALVVAAWLPSYLFVREPIPVACYDLRKNKNTMKYFVVVNSRDGETISHTFVTWTYNEDGKPTPTATSVGFYVQNGSNTVDAIMSSGGELLDETKVFNDIRAFGRELPNSRTAVVFWLDKEQFDGSLSVRRAWEPGKKYSLLTSDCVTFAAEVLHWFGLRIPARIFAISPHAFIRAVLEMNPDDKYKCKQS